jgi:hypothetical protein
MYENKDMYLLNVCVYVSFNERKKRDCKYVE